jgi:glycosyltransferase involved in cell wall biosynthesis
MRIAIDARALTGRYTGDRTYWRNLLRSLFREGADHDFLLYSRLPIPDGEIEPGAKVTCRVLPAQNDRLWTLFALPDAVRQDRADVLHVQYTVPPRSPCPVVTTVHDVSFRLYPHWFPIRHRVLLNLTVPPSMRRAARILTVSESSRKDILRCYPLPPEKVIATPLGLPAGYSVTLEQETARRLAKEKFGLEKPFVLAVGVLQPRKNLPMLAEAFGRMKAERQLPHSLVFAGKMGWGEGQAALCAAVERGGGSEAADSVVFTGYVEDGDLPLLYRACAAFAFPSLYEGFGLPPLEALACGAPVVASSAPAMPEVLGDAALLVPPTDVSAWADALARILCDTELRAALSARGPSRAARFDWNRTAQQTLAAYEEAVSL